MPDMQKWCAKKAQEQKRLYDQYGTSLAKEYTGAHVKISAHGQTGIGAFMGEVLHHAVEAFGPDHFAMARVGCPSLTRLLHASVYQATDFLTFLSESQPIIGMLRYLHSWTLIIPVSSLFHRAFSRWTLD